MLQLLNYEYGRRAFVAFAPGHFLVFTRLKQHIQQRCPDAAVEHVGSTAIPYIVGKRVIDLLVPCPAQGCSAILANLLQRGFQPSPFRRVGTDRFLLVAGTVFSGVFYNVHLQVCFKDSNTHWEPATFPEQIDCKREPVQALRSGQAGSDCFSQTSPCRIQPVQDEVYPGCPARP